MANGILNGTDLKVYDAGTLIAYATNATININHSTRSISNKESSGWEESMEGFRNWDVSVDAMYAWLDASGSGVTSSSTGDTKYTGTVWMTSASLTAPTEDSATYSASFQGSGALTQTIA